MSQWRAGRICYDLLQILRNPAVAEKPRDATYLKAFTYENHLMYPVTLNAYRHLRRARGQTQNVTV